MKLKKQTGLYKHWQKIANHQKHDFRASALRKLIIPNLNNKNNILDLGCGTCDLTQELLEKNYKVFSVDASSEMIEISKKILKIKKLSTRRVQKSSINVLVKKYKNYFFQIVCLDVIEHIKNDKLAINNIYKILKPGGILLLTVPALQKLYGKKDEEVGHYRRYEKEQLSSLLKSAGFQIIKTRSWNLIGVPIVWLSNKIFKTKASESFRYNESLKNRIIQKLLSFWFQNIENKFNFRIGLTLFVIAKKPK